MPPTVLVKRREVLREIIGEGIEKAKGLVAKPALTLDEQLEVEALIQGLREYMQVVADLNETILDQISEHEITTEIQEQNLDGHQKHALLKTEKKLCLVNQNADQISCNITHGLSSQYEVPMVSVNLMPILEIEEELHDLMEDLNDNSEQNMCHVRMTQTCPVRPQELLTPGDSEKENQFKSIDQQPDLEPVRSVELEPCITYEMPATQSLPKFQLETSSPVFSVTAVDYSGDVLVKDSCETTTQVWRDGSVQKMSAAKLQGCFQRRMITRLLLYDPYYEAEYCPLLLTKDLSELTFLKLYWLYWYI